jgi:hypothetical protein
MKVKVFGLALAAALLCGAAQAQTPAPQSVPAPKPTPTPDPTLPAAAQLLDKYIQALGGAATLDKFKTRVSRGSVEFVPMGVKGSYESSQKAPNLVVVTMNLTGLGVIQQGYDGRVGWGKDPFTGLRELAGGELAAVQRAGFINPGNWRKSYTSMKTTGRSKVGDREVYVVEGAHGGNDPDKLYFDTQTGLLLRMDGVVEGPQGRVNSESTFDDYREVDGVKVPFSARTVLGPVTIITRVEEVKHDAPLDDKIFAKPAA